MTKALFTIRRAGKIFGWTCFVVSCLIICLLKIQIYNEMRTLEHLRLEAIDGLMKSAKEIVTNTTRVYLDSRISQIVEKPVRDYIENESEQLIELYLKSDVEVLIQDTTRDMISIFIRNEIKRQISVYLDGIYPQNERLDTWRVRIEDRNDKEK